MRDIVTLDFELRLVAVFAVRLGSGGRISGVHVGSQLRSRKRRTEYYVGLSAGRHEP